jgi:hypothetical protein
MWNSGMARTESEERERLRERENVRPTEKKKSGNPKTLLKA